MSNNLFISYEIGADATREEQFRKAVMSLGNSTPLLNCSWYVNSAYNADEAVKILSRQLTKDDKLLVVNTSTDSVCWAGFEEKHAQRIRQNWKMNLRKPVLAS